LELPTHNFFAPLGTTGKELEPTEDTSDQTDGEQQQPPPPPNSQRGRLPPIILTSAINLIQLQKQLKGLVRAALSSKTQETEPQLSLKKWRIFQP
jgi:hypothetical protein